MACTSSQASLFTVGSQHPFPATGFKLGLLSPPLSGCPRRLRALSLQQLPRIPSPVNPTGSQSGPHPHLISAPLPKMGARNRGTSFFSLSVFPPLPTPHAEAAKKMTCHAGVGGGGGEEPELSAHTRTHSHTAADCSCPAAPLPCRLTAETPALPPAPPQHPHPTPHPITAPASREVFAKEKGKTSQMPSVGLLGGAEERTEAEKEGDRI